MKAMTLFAASAALIALSAPAHADAIDGDWCRADGKRMSIHGPPLCRALGSQRFRRPI